VPIYRYNGRALPCIIYSLVFRPAHREPFVRFGNAHAINRISVLACYEFVDKALSQDSVYQVERPPPCRVR
jgi:hypothetical protein